MINPLTDSPRAAAWALMASFCPFGKVRFTVKSSENVLAKAVRIKAAPGEMEKITIKADLLNNITEPITVELEEV